MAGDINERRKGMIELTERVRMLEELERAGKKSRENMHKQIAELKVESKAQTEELKLETHRQTEDLKDFVSEGFKDVAEQFKGFNKTCADCTKTMSTELATIKANYEWLNKMFKWASSGVAGSLTFFGTLLFQHHKVIK